MFLWLRLLICYFVFCLTHALPPWKNYNVETNEIIESDDFDLNTIPDLIVDFALAELRHYFKDKNETTITIPDVRTSFDENWLGLHVRGSLDLRRGSFRNPATIIRKGATHVERVNDSIVFSFAVGFAELSVRYEYYDLDLVGLEERGAAEVWIRENSVQFEVSVTYAPHCVVKLTRLQFTEIGGIETDVTGLGVFDSLADDIVAWIIAHYRQSFQSLVENAVQQRIDQELSHTHFCKRQYYFKQSE